MSTTSDKRKRDLGVDHFDQDTPAADLRPSEEERTRSHRLHEPTREAGGETPESFYSGTPDELDHDDLTRQYLEGYLDGLAGAGSIAAMRADLVFAELLDERREALRKGDARLHTHLWVHDPESGETYCHLHGRTR